MARGISGQGEWPLGAQRQPLQFSFSAFQTLLKTYRIGSVQLKHFEHVVFVEAFKKTIYIFSGSSGSLGPKGLLIIIAREMRKPVLNPPSKHGGAQCKLTWQMSKQRIQKLREFSFSVISTCFYRSFIIAQFATVSQTRYFRIPREEPSGRP